MIKKEKSYSNEVKKVAFPLLVCNWIFGMGILEYPLGRQHRILSGLYVSSTLIIYSSLSIYSYPHIIEFSRQIEANENIAKLFFGCHNFLIINSLLLGWHRSEKNHSILERGITADKFLHKIETNKNCHQVWKTQLRELLVQVLMIFVAISIINFSYIYKNVQTTQGTVSIIIFNYPLIVMSVVDATFIYLIKYSGSKFKSLNNLLKNTLTTTCDRPQHTNTLKYYDNKDDLEDEPKKIIIMSDKVYTISMARKAHLNFIIFCEMINEVFAIHILISILFATFLLTMSFYHSYGVFTSEISRVASYQHVFPMMGTLVIYSSIKIYLFTKCCSDVTQETITTGDIISEMYDEMITEESKDEIPVQNRAKDLRNRLLYCSFFEVNKNISNPMYLPVLFQIRNFEIQLIQRPLKFHLCNLVTLDYSLNQKVIAKVTTHLVILTQCGKVTLRTSE